MASVSEASNANDGACQNDVDFARCLSVDDGSLQSLQPIPHEPVIQERVEHLEKFPECPVSNQALLNPIESVLVRLALGHGQQLRKDHRIRNRRTDHNSFFGS